MPDTPRASTPPSSDVLDQLHELESRVVDRIRELTPFVAELEQLRAEAERMGIDLTNSKGARRAGAPAAEAAAGSGKRRPARRSAQGTRRRRKRSGESRAEQVARLVAEQPGVTVSQLGGLMGVDSTGLYRVVRDLEAEGRIRKEGRELVPVGGGAASEPGVVDAVEDEAAAGS